ncbi:hypothetical protein Ac2012v2_006143 [Leucoagaricus gongylophorus]
MPIWAHLPLPSPVTDYPDLNSDSLLQQTVAGINFLAFSGSNISLVLHDHRLHSSFPQREMVFPNDLLSVVHL